MRRKGNRMKIKYINSFDEDDTIDTDEILKDIDDFGDGPMEFESRVIEALVLEVLKKKGK